MPVPDTQLDERFSDAAAKAVTWERTREALTTAELFWLSTVRADGRPHVTPLVAVWDQDRLHFCTGGEEQKAVNLSAHPHVVLTTGCATWDRGLDVVLEGEAERVTDRATLERLAAAWRRKWDGRWAFEAREEGFGHADGSNVALVFAVAPARVLVFGKGEFSHTSHRF